MAEEAELQPGLQNQRAADQNSVQETMTCLEPKVASPENNDDNKQEFNLKHLQQVVRTALQQMHQRHAIMINQPTMTMTNQMRAEYYTIEPEKSGGLPTYVRLLKPVQTIVQEELSILEGISWMTHDDNKPHIISQLHRHLYTKAGRRGDYGQIIYPEEVELGKPIPKFALWQSPIRNVPIRAQNNPEPNDRQPEQNTEIVISMIPNPSLCEGSPLSAPRPILNCGALHLRGLSALDGHSEPSPKSNLVMNTFETLKPAFSWRDRVPPPPLAKVPGCIYQNEEARVHFQEGYQGYQFVGREVFFGPGLVLREYDWTFGTWSVRSHVWDATDDEGNVVKEIISIDESDDGMC